MNKPKLVVDISNVSEPARGVMSGEFHTFDSCRDNDERPQNAYYNGCVRCVKLACAIADAATLQCDITLIEEG